MSKTYTHAGVSKLDGEFKVRFANDAMRTKVLVKHGHSDIDIVELKNPMSKADAVAYLLSIDFATRDGKTNQAVLEALTVAAEKRSGTKTVQTAKAPKKAKVSMDTIKAKVEAKKSTAKSTVSRTEVETQLQNMEDAPF